MWVPFSALLGRSLGGVVLGSLKTIHTRNLCPIGYRPKPLFEGGHDCGILVLKFIEMWDGISKFDGKALLDYTTVSLPI